MSISSYLKQSAFQSMSSTANNCLILSMFCFLMLPVQSNLLITSVLQVFNLHPLLTYIFFPWHFEAAPAHCIPYGKYFTYITRNHHFIHFWAEMRVAEILFVCFCIIIIILPLLIASILDSQLKTVLTF